jgi:2-succinyl-6-hydroxy-2,4-cyclohexadiene-1-carboxylate synthase
VTIWALHGFLGLPSDFHQVQKFFTEKNKKILWKSVDYLKFSETSPAVALADWGASFNKLIRKLREDSGPQILLGYSQGGRLALHALQEDPSFWAGCVLISTGVGISEDEKPVRLESDNRWAQKFLTEDFVSTVRLWNSQSVFANSLAEPERLESQFNRPQLAGCLTQWSVARQKNFKEFLKASPVPLLYLSGSSDTKYVALGNELAQGNSSVEHRVINPASHRIVFDQPEQVSEAVTQWLLHLGTRLGS